MGTLYDRADIYDLIDNDYQKAWVKEHWQRVLEGKDVKTLLDISIGTGMSTLPLAELGVQLAGSDLSQEMLDRCRQKAKQQGIQISLIQCDFREVSTRMEGQYDCVASTGNSLGYVTNAEIPGVLEQMDALVKPGGYLYYDSRNWDQIMEEKPRFYTYSPHFLGETRMNLVQFWDYWPDGSMTFNILYTFEQENKIVQKEIFEEHYYPVSRSIFLCKLAAMGYQDIRLMPYPVQDTRYAAGEDAPWYCVMARKPQS